MEQVPVVILKPVHSLLEVSPVVIAGLNPYQTQILIYSSGAGIHNLLQLQSLQEDKAQGIRFRKPQGKVLLQDEAALE